MSAGNLGHATYVLALNSVQLTQGMQQAQQQTAQSAAQIATSLGQITTALNNNRTSAQNASSAIAGPNGFLNAVLRVTTGATLASAAVMGIQQAVAFAGEGFLGFNDKLDRAAVAWETFTGSTESAKLKVEELFEFSRRTPFTFEQVDKAGRMLAAFGGEAFASVKNIQLMGDVAAGAQRPLQMITYEVGQMYSYISQGRAFGDAARALVGFGALSGEVREQLERMRESGASADEMIKVFFDDLGRFSGQTERQAKTLSGAWTTFTDTFQSLIAIATRAPFDDLKDALNGVNTALDSDKAIEYAKNVGVVIQTVMIGIQLLGAGLKETLILIAGFMDMFMILILKGVEGVLEALDSIPGMDMSGQLAGVRGAIQAVQADILKQAGSLAEANKEVARLWAEGGKLAWFDAGKENADQYRAGQKKKQDESLDADAKAAADRYIAAMNQALTGLSGDQIESFGDLQGFVEEAMKGSVKGLRGNINIDQMLQDIRPLLAQAVNETVNGVAAINDTLNVDIGVTKVKTAMESLKEMLPPEVYAQVEAYVAELGEAENVANALAAALITLGNAQAAYTQTQSDATAAIKAANDEVTRLTEVMNNNAAVFEEQIEARQARIKNLDREARVANAEASANVDAANRSLEELRVSIAARNAEHERAERAAQERLDNLQDARTQHEGAFQAILDGTTGAFIEQQHSIDDVTRAILDRYNAEYEGKMRIASGDDKRVTRLEREERAKLLEMDQEIDRLRASGNGREADRLQRQRDAVEKRYDAEIARARQVAAVSNDRADQEKEKIEEAAAVQDRKDGKAVTQAEIDLKNIQTEGEARKAVDDAAIKAAEQKVALAEEEAKRVAKDFSDRKQAIQDEISDIQDRKEEKRKEDQAAVDGAKATAKEVKADWDERVRLAKINLDHAENTVTALKNQKSESDETLKALEKQTSEMGKQYGYALAILNTERARRGLAPVASVYDGTPLEPISPTQTTPLQLPPGESAPGGADPGYAAPPQDPVPTGTSSQPVNATPAPAPVADPGAARQSIIDSWLSAYGPMNYGPAMSYDYTPPGFHIEERPNGTFWVRDGWTMADDGSTVREDSVVPSAAPPENPSGGGLLASLRGQTAGAGILGSTGTRSAMAGVGAGFSNAAAGGKGGSTVTLDFSGMTVDSNDRATQVKDLVIGGLRTALQDVGDTEAPLFVPRRG